MPEFPCTICTKNVNKNHRAVCCDSCNQWIHIKCNLLSKSDYDNLQLDPDPFFCISCIKHNIPFSSLSHNEFTIVVTKGIYVPPEVEHKDQLQFLQSENYIKQLNEYITKSMLSPSDNIDEDTEDDGLAPINCNYYDLEDFSKAKFNSSKSFSIFHLNIHSIQLHIDELKTILNLLDFHFDILAISESKLQTNILPIVDISIEDYHSPVSTPSEASKGGVLLYVSKKHDFKPRNDLNIYEAKMLESSFIEIINQKKSNDVIGIVYRHPSMCADSFNANYISPLLLKLSLENNKNICIAGDFNFDLLKVSSHNPTSEFFDIMTSNFLLPTISLPTKINTSNDTLIDNIFTNKFNPDIISGNLTFNISDGHLPSFTIFPKANQQHLPKKHNLFKRNTKVFDRENFLLDILDLDWFNIIKIEKQDANYSFNAFYSSMESILDKYMPLVRVTNKDHKRKYKPWITNGILTSMRRRDTILKQYIRVKDPNRKLILHADYKHVRNKIVELIKISKQTFYKNYFSGNNNNLRRIWQGIRQIINVKSKSNDNPTCIIEGKKVITDPSEISNSFNVYFSNVAETILKERKYEGDGDFSKFLPPSQPNSICMYPVDGDEVCSIINKLNVNKAHGPVSIPSEILHLIKYEISKPISWIANICFSNGIHPDKLKLAKIIPIFKKGSKTIISNYRPISLLSNLNKIFEKLVFSRVYSFLDSNDSIYKLQYGFRPKYSTTHALINITEMIREALDHGKFACGIFVDFQKAFDTVNHKILIKKLAHYGIRGSLNDWFMSYLSNREQFVSILGNESKKHAMQHGVPQGSVLGPLLFLIYINDLHQSIKHSHVFHFADDTNLLNINKSLHDIQTQLNYDLRGLCLWLLANKISLNAAKTELIYFRKPLQNIPNNLKIKINGKKLFPTSSIKYLGIYLDEFLDGSYHCNILLTKLQRANGMIAKARHFTDFSGILSIYHSLFSSHMLYGCQIWGQSDNKFFNKIKVLQNNALRLITFSDSFHDHVTPLYIKLTLLKLRDIVSLNNYLLIHDYFNEKLPECFSGFFNLAKDTHPHNTRNAASGNLFIPDSDSVRYGRNSIKISSILSWNNFIKNFPGVDFIQLSRVKIKSFIVNYFLDCYIKNQ